MLEHAWIIPALPIAAAALVGLLGRRINRFAGWITSAAIAGSLLLALRLMWDVLAHPGVKEITLPWLQTAGGLMIQMGMLIDPLSSVMLVIVTFVSLMVQVYSLGYMAEDEGIGRYFAFLSLFTFSMLGLVLSNNLIFLYMFWELVGLSSYLLIGFWYKKPEAANAAKKAFVVTRFGDMGFLIGILVVGYFLNTFNILALGDAVKAGKLAGGLATAVALLLFCGAMGKSGQFPLHIWLPDAMEGPTPVSALIHAATMVAAGVFMVARLFPLFAASETAMLTVSYIGGFTAIFAATIACVQDDIKRILAYSTLSQLGYMVMALGCGGYTAGMFHLTTHAAFKALLFLAAGSVIHAVHTNDIWKMGGLCRSMGITTAVMLIASLALAGVFPFAGFFSKDEVLVSTFLAGRMDLLFVGLLTALLTSFYIFRMFFVVFAGKPATDKHAHEASWVMTIPMLLLSILAAGLGAATAPFGHFLQASFGAPAMETEYHGRLIPALATLMAVLGFAWAYLVYLQKAVSASLLMRRFLPIYTLLKNKYYIDEMYQWAVQRIMFVVSRALAWFDRNIVDGAVNGVAWLCRLTGDGLSRLQQGRLQTYLIMFVAGVVIIIMVVLASNPTVLAWMK
jgi:NADH-quinone oxidoreductase subunit L